MTAADFLAEIRKSIAKGDDLRVVFSRIEFLIKGKASQLEITHTRSRYETLQREIRLGTLDFQTQNIERNRITASLLSFIDTIDEEIKDNNKFKDNIESEIDKYFEKEASSPNFYEWLNQNRKIKNLTIGFAILYTISLIIYLLYQKDLEKWILPTIVHWIFVLTVAFWLFRFKRYSIDTNTTETGEIPEFVKEKNNAEKRIRDRLRLTKLTNYDDWSENEKQQLWNIYKKGVNETLEQFTTGWFFMWALWALFYVVILCGVKVEWIYDLVNYLGTATFLFMYLTLTISTTGRIIFSLLMKILLVVVMITAVQYFLTQRIVYFGSDQQQVQFWFRLIIGLIACATFSTVFGRLLDSKFVNTPTLLSMLMYGYAAIQPLYAFFDFSDMTLYYKVTVNKIDAATMAIKQIEEEKESHIKIVPLMLFFILSVAFYMKLLLFLIITWILRSGRLLYFVSQEGSLNYKQDDDIKEFMQNISIENSKLI